MKNFKFINKLKQEKTEIGIVIPCYGKPYSDVIEAINSAIEVKKYVNINIIVVYQNNSKYNYGTMLSNYKNDITLIKTVDDKVYKNKKVGFAATILNSRFMMVLDPDDSVYPKKIEKISQKLSLLKDDNYFVNINPYVTSEKWYKAFFWHQHLSNGWKFPFSIFVFHNSISIYPTQKIAEIYKKSKNNKIFDDLTYADVHLGMFLINTFEKIKYLKISEFAYKANTDGGKERAVERINTMNPDYETLFKILNQYKVIDIWNKFNYSYFNMIMKIIRYLLDNKKITNEQISNLLKFFAKRNTITDNNIIDEVIRYINKL